MRLRSSITFALLLAGCDKLFSLASLPDARLDDAFIPAMHCPEGYTSLELLPEGSLYRANLSGLTVLAHHYDCEDDLPDATHLVTIETVREMQAVQMFVDGQTAFDWHIGAVQPLGSTEKAGGWMWLTGTPTEVVLWWTAGSEPDDGPDNVENSEENGANVRKGALGIIDVPQGRGRPALCECDGLAIDPATAALLEAL